MRKILPFIILLFFAYGCNGSPTSEPSTHVSVSVSYKSGFRGDSIVLRCDGAILERGHVFSDSMYVPSGCLFNVKEGVHTFEVLLPRLNIQTDTTFNASAAYRTEIGVSFDQKGKIFRCDIAYLDTSQTASSHPADRSIESMMPR
jgi:hypothetical protein